MKIQNIVEMIAIKNNNFEHISERIVDYLTTADNSHGGQRIITDERRLELVSYWFRAFNYLNLSVKFDIPTITLALGTKTDGFNRGDFYMIINFGRHLENDEINNLDYKMIRSCDNSMASSFNIEVNQTIQNTMLFITEE